MASDKEAEKLRKQIDVLSSLISSHKDLRKKEIAAKNNNGNASYSTKYYNPNSSTSMQYVNTKSSTNYTLDKRKTQQKINHHNNPSQHPQNTQIMPSEKHQELKNTHEKTKHTSTLLENRNQKSRNPSSVNTMRSSSTALLSARLSCLSSSIANTKSKLKASHTTKQSKQHEPNPNASKQLSKLSLNTSKHSSQSSKIPSKSGLKWTKDKKETTLVITSANTQSKPSISGLQWTRGQNKQANSGSKWTKDQNKQTALKVRKNCSVETSKDLSYTVQKTQVSTQMKYSTPVAKSLLKWRKQTPSDDSLTPQHTKDCVNKHVWRSKGSVKIYRKRSNSAGSSNGFMKRRQMVVQRNSAKKKGLSSRYHFVSSAKKKSFDLKATHRVKHIDGGLYKTSANKLDKQSPDNENQATNIAKQKSSKLLNISGKKYVVNASRKTLKRVHSTPAKPAIPPKKRLSLSKAGSARPGMKTVSSQIRRRSVQNALHYKYKEKAKSSQFCMFFNRFGKCNKGDSCPYIHDPSKVAVCTKFLKGKCDITDGSCPFSHKIDKAKMPVCQYFLKDMCTKEDCPYSHVNVSSKAEVCQDFLKGYCPLGQKCKKKHIVDCEEFLLTGKCSKGKKCNLMHRVNKPRKRKRKSLDEQKTDQKMSKIIMTDDEGFLPLTTESTGKEAGKTEPNVVLKQKEALSIKPRFLVDKESQDKKRISINE